MKAIILCIFLILKHQFSSDIFCFAKLIIIEHRREKFCIIFTGFLEEFSKYVAYRGHSLMTFTMNKEGKRVGDTQNCGQFC